MDEDVEGVSECASYNVKYSEEYWPGSVFNIVCDDHRDSNDNEGYNDAIWLAVNKKFRNLWMPFEDHLSSSCMRFGPINISIISLLDFVKLVELVLTFWGNFTFIAEVIDW